MRGLNLSKAKSDRSDRTADGNAGTPRRFIAASIAIAALLAGGFVALAVALFNFLHGDELSDRRDASTLPPVTITGAQQTVLDWSKQGCSAYDYADLPARAYRDADGRVQLIISHFVNRRMSGPSLGRLRHSCDVVLGSDNDPNPARFNDREWIAAPYTTDGKTVYALLHQEYQGHRHAGRCPSRVYLKCWYNAITFARSNDGGRTFQQPTPPRQLVASVPYPYVPEKGPYGLFSPSNIVRNPRDSYYYALVTAEDYDAQKWGSCLIRTAELSSPRQWRAWGGSSFNVRFINPYRPNSNRSDHVCTPVSPNEIRLMSSTIAWSSHFNKWLLIGTAAERSRSGRTIWGIYYSLSDDLTHWQYRKLIREAEFVYSYECGDRNPIMYPSLLDHHSRSRNFETVGKRAWLYFTRLRYKDCKLTSNRDLVRVPISFG